ncbi:MAG: vWA domain-containing protein, partial [Planctomycetaceae bacterium]
ARTQLWKIVNELATARQAGQLPDLELALYEYGKSSLPASEGHLRMIVPFTDNLDKISEELFILETNGGEEYCGHVIDAATKGLKWSASDGDLKLIFIAGNEPFTQGAVDYKTACAAAIQRGITVNTIYCGDRSEGISTGWEEGAKLADGSFMHIDQNQAVAAITTPYDRKLAELSGEVNETYLFFGAAEKRETLSRRQLAQDTAAESLALSAGAERAQFKASGGYGFSDSDLIDALREKTVELEDLKDEQLPKELQGKSLEEKQAVLKEKSQEREKIQNEIRKLSEQRKKYIAEKQREQTKSDVNTLDDAIIQAIRTQAQRKRFTFEE